MSTGLHKRSVFPCSGSILMRHNQREWLDFTGAGAAPRRDQPEDAAGGGKHEAFLRF
jgi:hypothetical protein